MAFAQLGTVHSQNHWHMTELRRLPAQCFVNQQLLRSVGKMLLGTQYVSHAHQMVIDTNSEVIGRNTVGFYNYEIVELVHVKGNFAMNQVMNGDAALGRNFDTNGIRFACSDTCFSLFCRNIAAGTCITERLLSSALFFTLCSQILGSAEAVVCFAFVQQLLSIFFVDIKALGLIVRTVFAAGLRAFIPVDAQPFQAGKDLAYGILFQAFNIGILNTQNQLAAHFAGKQPVKQRSTRTTNM